MRAGHGTAGSGACMLQCWVSALALAAQAWKYQAWVQEAIDKRLDKLADVPAPTIGFHVRWGAA